MINLLQDIKRILALVCVSNIAGLKERLLTSEIDQRIYGFCTRRSTEEIANMVPELGHTAVYGRLTEWEKKGLVIAEQESVGRGRPTKFFIRVEEFLR